MKRGKTLLSSTTTTEHSQSLGLLQSPPENLPQAEQYRSQGNESSSIISDSSIPMVTEESVHETLNRLPDYAHGRLHSEMRKLDNTVLSETSDQLLDQKIPRNTPNQTPKLTEIKPKRIEPDDGAVSRYLSQISEIVKRGFLTMLDQNSHESKVVYAVLERQFLRYHHLSEGNLVDTIDMVECKIAVHRNVSDAFRITSRSEGRWPRSRNYIFVAGSEEERREWILAMLQVSEQVGPRIALASVEEPMYSELTTLQNPETSTTISIGSKSGTELDEKRKKQLFAVDEAYEAKLEEDITDEKPHEFVTDKLARGQIADDDFPSQGLSNSGPSADSYWRYANILQAVNDRDNDRCIAPTITFRRCLYKVSSRDRKRAKALIARAESLTDQSERDNVLEDCILLQCCIRHRRVLEAKPKTFHQLIERYSRGILYPLQQVSENEEDSLLKEKAILDQFTSYRKDKEPLNPGEELLGLSKSGDDQQDPMAVAGESGQTQHSLDWSFRDSSPIVRKPWLSERPHSESVEVSSLNNRRRVELRDHDNRAQDYDSANMLTRFEDQDPDEELYHDHNPLPPSVLDEPDPRRPSIARVAENSELHAQHQTHPEALIQMGESANIPEGKVSATNEDHYPYSRGWYQKKVEESRYRKLPTDTLWEGIGIRRNPNARDAVARRAETLMKLSSFFLGVDPQIKLSQVFPVDHAINMMDEACRRDIQSRRPNCTKEFRHLLWASFLRDEWYHASNAGYPKHVVELHEHGLFGGLDAHDLVGSFSEARTSLIEDRVMAADIEPIKKASTEVAESVSNQSQIRDSKPPVTTDLSIVSDSGYASMDRPLASHVKRADTEEPSNSGEELHNRTDEGSFDDTRFNENRLDDIVSVVSDTQDIGSQIITKISSQQEFAEQVVSAVLADHLRSFVEKALERMSFERLQRNVRRLLKDFYLDLLPLADDNLRKATVNVLRSRHGRTRITYEALNSITLNQEESETHVEKHNQAEDNKKEFLEAWISQNQAFAKPIMAESADIQKNKEDEVQHEKVFETRGKAESDSSSEVSEASEAHETLEKPRIAEMETFLFKGQAFEMLVFRAYTFLLPRELQPLLRVILSVPKEKVWFERDYPSFTDSCKEFVENRTSEDWNWWPLAQRKRMLTPDQTRMHWRCVSFI